MSSEKLDAKDMAILAALDKDVRASANEIGKIVRLKPETVHYRIKRLEERGVITGYYAFVFPRASLVVRKLFLKNRSLAGAERDAFITFALDSPLVAWLADTEGVYDIAVTIVAPSDVACARFLDELTNRFGKHFSERQLLLSTRGTMTNEKYLASGKFLHAHTLDFLSDPPSMDEIDDILVHELSRNSRVSYVELAKAAGLTPEAISYRIRALTKSGAIVGLRLRINFAKLNLVYVHVLISLVDASAREELERFARVHPDCVYTMRYLGLYDMHLELIALPDRIPQFLDALRAKFGNVLARVDLLTIRNEHTLHVLR